MDQSRDDNVVMAEVSDRCRQGMLIRGMSCLSVEVEWCGLIEPRRACILTLDGKSNLNSYHILQSTSTYKCAYQY